MPACIWPGGVSKHVMGRVVSLPRLVSTWGCLPEGVSTLGGVYQVGVYPGWCLPSGCLLKSGVSAQKVSLPRWCLSRGVPTQGVCLPRGCVCSGGVSVQGCVYPQGVSVYREGGGVCPGECTPIDPKTDPPPRMTIKVGSMYPTGMHSCLVLTMIFPYVDLCKNDTNWMLPPSLTQMIIMKVFLIVPRC